MRTELPDIVFFLEGNSKSKPSLLAWGCSAMLAINAGDGETLSKISKFTAPSPDWIFGYISYDLKNSFENLKSKNPDHLKAPLVQFVKPEFVVEIVGEKIEVHMGDWTEAIKITQSFLAAIKHEGGGHGEIVLEPRLSKHGYLEAVAAIQNHIQLGDIYELNYCQEFFAGEKIQDPLLVFSKLNAIARAPMSVFVRLKNLYIVSASPERFLKRTGSHVITQPIKGTARRSTSKEEDQALKNALACSRKERSENVMITDLVRNDLSRIAMPGSVRVEELCGVYSFDTVHQMISTVSCEVAAGTTFPDLLAATFPMGSMTGAPKISAMNLIDEYEKTSRGIYSGCIGYIAPNGDFDFNVVIRSILYRDDLPYITASVGSAITALCNSESEYRECLIKLEALQKALL